MSSLPVLAFNKSDRGVMSFDISTLPDLSFFTLRVNNAEIKKSKHHYTLSYQGKQWMTLNQTHNIQAKELYSSYDQAYGDVVLSGLGFGLLALWIASKPGVTSVRVYEKNYDIITLFRANNPLAQIAIINQDINDVITSCDCLFLDHYEFESTEERLQNIGKIRAKIEHKTFWAWGLERDHAYTVYNLTQEQCYGMHLTLHLIDFRERWSELGLDIPAPQKLNEYVYTFFDKVGYTFLE
jgi:hypothetical protein